MKKLIFILFLVLALEYVHAGSNNDIFNKANQLYIEENYSEAINEYLRIYTSGFESAELFYNIGNCYYKIEEYPKAQLFYYRALKLNPGDKKAKFNLEKAKLYNVDKLEEIPPFFLSNIYRIITGLASSNAWAVISIILFILALVSLMLYFVMRQTGIRKAGFWMGVTFALFSLMFYCFSYSVKKKNLYVKEGIIMAPTVIVKNSPDIDDKDKYVIHEGIKATVTDSLDNWYEIHLSDGKDGWILKSEIELI